MNKFNHSREFYEKRVTSSMDNQIKFEQDFIEGLVDFNSNKKTQKSILFDETIKTLKIKETIINNIEKMMKIATTTVEYFSFLPNELRCIEIIALYCIRRNGYLIRSVPVKSINRKMVIEAVKLIPKIIEFLPDEYKNDYEIAVMCVKKRGMTLQFFSDDIKNNYYIVENAIKQNCNSAKYASNILIESGVLIDSIIESIDFDIDFDDFPKIIGNDPIFLSKVINKNVLFYYKIPKKFKKNDLVFKALLNAENNKEILFHMLEKDPFIFYDLLRENKLNEEICQYIIQIMANKYGNSIENDKNTLLRFDAMKEFIFIMQK